MLTNGNNENNHLLNKYNFNCNYIDDRTIYILSNIIHDINNNEEFDNNTFVKQLYSSLKLQDKNYLVLKYLNDNINYNFCNREYIPHNNIINRLNRNKIKNTKYNKYNHKYRLYSGTEKKKNFFYL